MATVDCLLERLKLKLIKNEKIKNTKGVLEKEAFST